MTMSIRKIWISGALVALGLSWAVAPVSPAWSAPKKKPAAVGEAKNPEPEETEATTEAAEKREEQSPPGPRDGRMTGLISRMVLKVINPEDARTALTEKAKELGGFPILVTDDSIEFKIPPESLSVILAYAAEQGLVVEKSLEREDLTQEIAQLEGQLKSKRDILRKLRSFFDDSNVQATLRIEQTMTDLVNEMENVKGRLRVLNERSRWARVDVSFQFKQRDRIIYVNSPFEWLNTVNLDRFLEEF